MEYKDYYAILGVEKNASEDDIKRAYRRLARKYHPDVSKEKNAEEQFKNLQEAYEVLKDQEKRNAYNQLGNNWKSGQEFRPPPDWQQVAQFNRGNGQSFNAEDLGEFSDFFANLFGGGRAAGPRGHARQAGFNQRGSDQHATLSIMLEEAFQGASKTFQIQIPEVDANGNVRATVKTLKVTIPAGAEPGQRLRLAKQGAPGMGDAPAGDLYLEIAIAPHPFFSLQGQDVYITLPVTPWEAALGAEIKVPTLGGPVGMKLAGGAQSGQKLRLKGRGMPGKPHAGDQYAILQIHTPSAKTAEQRQLYEKMAETMPFNPREDWSI